MMMCDFLVFGGSVVSAVATIWVTGHCTWRWPVQSVCKVMMVMIIIINHYVLNLYIFDIGVVYKNLTTTVAVGEICPLSISVLDCKQQNDWTIYNVNLTFNGSKIILRFFRPKDLGKKKQSEKTVLKKIREKVLMV